MSIKNYIDSSRDLTMMHAGQATALAAHLRTDGNGTGYSSAIGSKASGLASNNAKSAIGKVGKDQVTAGGAAGLKQSKKKKEYELAKDKILAHLDLT